MSKSLKIKSLIVSIIALVCCVIGLISVNVTHASTAPALSVRATADIRVASDGHNGIRFTADITNKSNDYNYYMAIVPEDYLSHEAYTATDGNTIEKLEAVISALNTANGTSMTLNVGWCAPVEESTDVWIIKHSITNVRYDNSNRNFVAVAYAQEANNELADPICSAISAPQSLTVLSAKGLASGQFDEGQPYEQNKPVIDGFIDNGFKKAVGISEADASSTARPVLTATLPASISVNAGDRANVDVVIKDASETTAVGLDGLITMVKGDGYPDKYVAYDSGELQANAVLITNEFNVEFSSLASLVGFTSSTTTLKINQTNKDIFSQAYALASDVGMGGWQPITNSNLTRSYDADEQAIKVNLVGANAGEESSNNGLASRGMVAYLTNAELKKQLAEGKNTLTFSVKGDANAIGIRIYSKATNATGQTGGQEVSAIKDGTTGVKVYKDVMLTTEYQTVNINLEVFLGLQDANFIGIVFKGAQGANFYLKEAVFSTQTYDNIFSESYKWTIQTPARFSSTADSESITFTAKESTASGLNLRDSVVYLSASKLQEKYNANNNSLSFEVKASGTASIRIYAKQNDGREASNVLDTTDGIGAIQDVTLTTEYQTVTVNLDNFFNEFGVSETNYIGIVLYMAQNVSITFKGSSYSYNLFGSSASWTNLGTYASVIARSNEALFRMTLSSGCNDINYRETMVITSAQTLKELYQTGQYDTLTFKARAYKGTSAGVEETGDATITTQIRVFTKQTNVLEAVQIKTETAGIGNTQDFTLTKEYQEFSIDLEALFGDEELGVTNSNYIGILMVSDTGWCFSLKDAVLKKNQAI